MFSALSIFLLICCSTTSNAFSTGKSPTVNQQRAIRDVITINTSQKNEISPFISMGKALLTFTLVGMNVLCPNHALADEYGREVEAPTLFTGETTMICTKRGPLGACLQTAVRTPENDNDKATKYFNDPAANLKEKYNAPQLQTLNNVKTDVDGNALIEKLRQQSEENKDRNDKIVRQKTLQNDLGASFGPLDRQVVILNSDGDSYTLLDGAQAMRLKKAGYIKDRRFVTQPTQETIDEALNAPEPEGGFLGNIVKGVFGSREE